MYWERVTEEIYQFTSDRYALVNSMAVLSSEGIVVIDALPFPDEARQIAKFLEVRVIVGMRNFTASNSGLLARASASDCSPISNSFWRQSSWATMSR